jgi:hypothetical protein
MYVLYYASIFRCWHLVWILVRTNYTYLGVGCHMKPSLTHHTSNGLQHEFQHSSQDFSLTAVNGIIGRGREKFVHNTEIKRAML